MSRTKPSCRRNVEYGFTLAAIACAFLSACGETRDAAPGTTAGTSPAATDAVDAGRQGPVELVFAHALEGQAARALEGVIGEFDRSREDLTVTIARETRIGREKLLADAVSTGSGPDVFLAGDMFAPDWIETKHILQPLDRLMVARGVSVADTVLPRYLSRVSSGGLAYGLPLSIRIAIFVANPDTVRRGCDMTGSPAVNATRPIGIDTADWMTIAAFIGAFDASLLDGAGTPAFDSEGASRAIEFMRANILSGGLKTAVDDNGVIGLFNSGKVNAVMAWPDQISEISPDKPWIIMPMPGIEGAGRVKPIWQVDTLYISSWSRHIDAAADLVAWITADQRLHALERDGFPGLFTFNREHDTDYASSPVSLGIRKQQAAALPFPVFKATATAVEIFNETTSPMVAETKAPAPDIAAALAEAAGRARAAVTKIRQGQSIILR